MKKSKKKQTQIKMGLKYSGGSIFKRIRYRISKFSILLDQYMFWRTPLLWFDIFLNVTATILSTTWIYSNWDKLPDKVSLWYYFFDDIKRFNSSTDIINLIFIHLAIQTVSLLLAYKISPRFRPLATFLLVCICIASLSFYIAIYKSLSLVVT